MGWRRGLVALLLTVAFGACHRAESPLDSAETPAATTAPLRAPNPSTDLAYVCPMDRDVRANQPGKCRRCGMALVANIPEPVEYDLDLSVTPQSPQPNASTQLAFTIFDPWKHNGVNSFSVVHEKLFHAFIISRDLQFFVHDHPVWDKGVFRYQTRFPKPGMYRILADFYPEAATPQLLTQTFFVTGTETPPAALTRDDSAKSAENVTVGLTVSPREPVAGTTAQMRFVLTPSDGIEKYLGAWGHMLAASDDLIDMIHTHPFIADGSPEMQFSLVFPRPRTYRIWVQFQRHGVVNTAHFDIPVQPAAPTNAD
jgi:hypothetical protein